ncbi:MAG: NUDIX domain-containing protein [Dehalococcoidia bacterium]|nr:NUDIX domain-containing protein [Dehalococcoidia bacterium]
MRSAEFEHNKESDAKGPAQIARCVAGALICDSKILLVRRSPQRRFYPGVWDLFGGHIEGEESAEDALRREALEELLVQIESFRVLGTIYDPVESAEIIIFAISEWRGEPVNAAPDEHSEISWFEAERLPCSIALNSYGELAVQAAIASSEVEVEITPTNEGLLTQKRTTAQHPVDRIYGLLDRGGNTDDYIEEIRGR